MTQHHEPIISGKFNGIIQIFQEKKTVSENELQQVLLVEVKETWDANQIESLITQMTE